MGVIIDTSGQIYKKLDAANISLSQILSGETKIEGSEAEVIAAIAQVQKSIDMVVAVLPALVAAIDEIDQLYQFIVKAPVTVGFDVSAVTTSPQPTPDKPGP